jgi:amino acid permease
MLTDPRASVEEEEEFEELVQSFMRDTHYTSTKQAAFNIMYAIINAGLVILPFAANCSGAALFAVLICLASALSGYTSVMLVRMANDLQVRRYEDLGERAFGINGYYGISILQIAFALLTMIV